MAAPRAHRFAAAALLSALLLTVAGAPKAVTAASGLVRSLVRPAPAAASPHLTIIAMPSLSALVLDEAHDRIYGSDSAHGQVRVVHRDLTTVATFDVGAASQPQGIDLSSDGSTLAVARAAAGDIALVDTASGTIVRTLVPKVPAGSPDVPFDV